MFDFFLRKMITYIDKSWWNLFEWPKHFDLSRRLNLQNRGDESDTFFIFLNDSSFFDQSMIKGINISPLADKSCVWIHFWKWQKRGSQQSCSFAFVVIVNFDDVLESPFVGVTKLTDLVSKTDQILMFIAVHNKSIHGLNIKLIKQTSAIKLKSLIEIATQNGNIEVCW